MPYKLCDMCLRFERHHMFGGGPPYLFCEACERTIYTEEALCGHNANCYKKLIWPKPKVKRGE